MLTPKEVMEEIVKALDSKKARDIKLLHVEDRTVIADETGKALSELGEPPLRSEGYRSGGWVLLDFGCVVVHLFLQEMRQFYDLERLWSDAPQVDISALLTD